MSEIVNLKRHRKRLAREDKENKAQVSRDRFGQSKAERQKSGADKARADRHLDGHKRQS